MAHEWHASNQFNILLSFMDEMLINLGRVGKEWAGGVWGGVRSVQSWGKECIENVETIEGPELHTALITHCEKASLCCEHFLTLMGLH